MCWAPWPLEPYQDVGKTTGISALAVQLCLWPGPLFVAYASRYGFQPPWLLSAWRRWRFKWENTKGEISILLRMMSYSFTSHPSARFMQSPDWEGQGTTILITLLTIFITAVLTFISNIVICQQVLWRQGNSWTAQYLAIIVEKALLPGRPFNGQDIHTFRNWYSGVEPRSVHRYTLHYPTTEVLRCSDPPSKEIYCLLIKNLEKNLYYRTATLESASILRLYNDTVSISEVTLNLPHVSYRFTKPSSNGHDHDSMKFLVLKSQDMVGYFSFADPLKHGNKPRPHG
jgi:hypothetical protein